MENLKLNETPVRTARNFKINNMKLENIEVPEVIPTFENVIIIGDTSKINIEQNADNTNTNDNTTAKTFFVIFFINKVPHFLNCNILCRLLYIDFLLL